MILLNHFSEALVHVLSLLPPDFSEGLCTLLCPDREAKSHSMPDKTTGTDSPSFSGSRFSLSQLPAEYLFLQALGSKDNPNTHSLHRQAQCCLCQRLIIPHTLPCSSLGICLQHICTGIITEETERTEKNYPRHQISVYTASAIILAKFLRPEHLAYPSDPTKRSTRCPPASMAHGLQNSLVLASLTASTIGPVSVCTKP